MIPYLIPAMLILIVLLLVATICHHADAIAAYLFPRVERECQAGHPPYYGPSCPVCERLARGWPRRAR